MLLLYLSTYLYTGIQGSENNMDAIENAMYDMVILTPPPKVLYISCVYNLIVCRSEHMHVLYSIVLYCNNHDLMLKHVRYIHAPPFYVYTTEIDLILYESYIASKLACYIKNLWINLEGFTAILIV